MSSRFGNIISVQIFGQSHSAGIGAVIDGLPAGEPIDMDKIAEFMARRAPGTGAHTTSRREPDKPRILSGISDGKTCGAPLCAVIDNADTRSGDYAGLDDTPRPGHADYTAHIKYRGSNDIRGGGHFSGRLTAPLCFAGGVCMQILNRYGVRIYARIASVGGIADPLDTTNMSQTELERVFAQKHTSFPALSENAASAMLAEIAAAKAGGDSVGGVVELIALGLPIGLGEPMFGGVENALAAAIFGIPAVKGVEFGAGFAAASMRGSQNNDSFYIESDKIATATNNHGGILGGITSGMPLILRAAFKPTSSISLPQNTISLSQRRNAPLQIRGRHDPCIVPRAVPVVEAVTAAVLLDLMAVAQLLPSV